MDSKTIDELLHGRVTDAETRYLQSKQRFLEEAVSDPATAIALGATVVERQSHFESLKKAQGYLLGGDYQSSLEAVKAALDYFKTVLVRSSGGSRSACDFSNGVELAEKKGVKDTVQALEWFVQQEAVLS